MLMSLISLCLSSFAFDLALENFDVWNRRYSDPSIDLSTPTINSIS